ncbi:hypothetical protein FRC07_014916, partial [Ceratobasidium sp. 392]
SIHDTGSLVSSGEDRTVRVWEDGELVQTITHPAISVWAVSAMPNGDIVTGCSDGLVRVFSRSESRWADEATLKEYESQVASQAIPAEQVGDVKKSDLPGPEALERPGNKDGQILMVKTVGGSVEAHEWSAGQGKWVKVGEVVDAVGQNRKQLFEGKEYDYVFKVDIKDGEPPLSLPYNATENPYSAAQRFLASNDLSMEYLDQVVSFIEKNSGGVKVQSGQDFVDPYTGASRYQAPPSTGTQSSNANSYVDPFTGANRYAPPSSTPTYAAPTPPPPKPANSILPVKMPLAFKQANIPAMETKFKQLNDGLSGDPNTSSLALTPLEFKLFNRSFALMKSKADAPPIAPADSGAELSQKDVDIITDVLARWPSLQRFPVVDLIRLLIAYSPVTFESPATSQKLIDALFEASEWKATPWPVPLPKHRETNVLLTLRALSNLFQVSSQWKVTGNGPWVSGLFKTLSEAPYEGLTKTQRVALATIAFNYSVVELVGQLDPLAAPSHVSLVTLILNHEKEDGETGYRALVALGNIIYTTKQRGSLSDVATAAYKPLLASVAATFREERVASLVQEIKAVMG